MSENQFDVVVIGAGPGGYPAAIRAAQLGLKTACVEANHWGGICLNWGCIPTKSLLKNAEIWRMIKHHTGDFGIQVDNPRFDFAAVVKRSRAVADQMNRGIQFLIKKYKVTRVDGRGTITAKGEVSVEGSDGKKSVLKANNIVIATGARPRAFPGMEIDHKVVITSKEALALPALPKSIVIIGAGAIGVEFAYFFNAFGVKVELVEAMDRLLPVEDDDVSAELAKSFKAQGVSVRLGVKVKSARAAGGRAKVVLDKGGTDEVLEADLCLVAVGVTGNIENLGLEALGVKVERGAIVVDGYAATNVPGVYAVGDVAGPPWLAHKATHQALACVEKLAGKEVVPFVADNVPGCTYCQPQVASVGLTEREAKKRGLTYKVGRFPFKASGKANAIGETDGFVKVIVGEPWGEILGAHIIGSEATEMICEYTMARELEADAEALVHTIHAHPTLSEAMMEAAAVTSNECVHL